MISQKRYAYLCFYLLLLVAFALPLTKIVLSWTTVLFAVTFLIGPDLKSRSKCAVSNPIFLSLVLFYFLNILGLFWSNDVYSGIKLLKGYLPWLIVPLVLTSIQLSYEQIRNISLVFTISLLVTSIYNVLYINGLFGEIKGDDIREMSRFGSHIRYALLIVFGILICFNLWGNWATSISKKSFLLLSILWLLFYTFYSQVLTGVICLASLIIIYISFYLYQSKGIIGLLITPTLLFVFSTWLIIHLYPSKNAVDCIGLPNTTLKGNPYTHDCTLKSEINNHPIYAYYCEEEMFAAWNERSKIDILDNDKRNHPIRMTLARYLTAKNFHKDEEGIRQLTDKDIKNIELGKVYPNENNDLLLTRIYGIKYELMNSHNPNGKSLLQRLEHWKTSLYIMKSHLFIGVGTGGNQQAFDHAYQETNSPLDKDHRLRSHNQFFAIQIGLGILGSLAFLIVLFQIIRSSLIEKCLFTLSSISILITSFFIEDTLETQVGSYLFGFMLLLIMQKSVNRHQKTIE